MITANPISFNNVSSFGTPSAIIVGLSSFHKALERDIECTFLNPKEFAINIIYTHVTGETVVYPVIKDDPHEEIGIGETKVSDINIEIFIQQSKLKRRITSGDKFVMNGVVYEVKDDRPDGVGITMVYAKRFKDGTAHTY